MNNIMLFVLLGASVLSYSVKQALDDTVFRVDIGSPLVTIADLDNNTDISDIDGNLSLSFDDYTRLSFDDGTRNTVNVSNLTRGEDLLDCGKRRQCSGKCQTLGEDDADRECRCDILCWFFGDCCVGYYDDCLHVGLNDTDHAIMLATLSKLGSYRQARILRRTLKLVKMSTCRAVPNNPLSAHLVGECSADPETEIKFHALHQKLTKSLPGQDINFFGGISKDELIIKCRGSSRKGGKVHALEAIPVTLVDTYTIDFRNVFCAICNGIDPQDVKYWDSNIVCSGKNNTTEYASGTVLNVYDTSTKHCQTHPILSRTARNCIIPFVYSAPNNVIRYYYPANSSSVSNHAEGVRNFTENNSSVDLFRLTEGDSWGTQVNTLSYDLHNGTRSGHNDNGNGSLDERRQQIQLRYELLTCSAQSERARFCQMYKYSFYSGVDLYNNPHCLPCLSLREHHNDSANFWDSFACPKYICSCYPDNLEGFYGYGNKVTPTKDKIPRIHEILFIASFRIVFDFHRHTSKVMVDNHYLNVTTGICPENQTYVPHYQGCRQIVCPLGMHLLGLTCVADHSQGEDRNTDQENFYDKPFQERLALVRATKRITMRMKFRYIFDIQRRGDSKEALIHDDGLGGGSSTNKGISQDIYQGQNGSPELAGDTTVIQSSIDKFSILDINRMRSLWNQASRQHGVDDISEAAKRLSTGVNETLIRHINGSGGILHAINLWSDFDTEQGNSVHMSISSDFEDAAYVNVLLMRLAHWGCDENLTRIANDNNFMFDRVVISSEPSNASLRVSKSDEGGWMQPCSEGEELVYNKFDVFVGENGSHAIRVRNKTMPLGETMFTVTVDLNDAEKEIGLSTADIGVCQRHPTNINCSYVYFNRSDFVVYQESLVTTTRAEDLAHFLGELKSYERESSSLENLTAQFEQQYGQSEINIHQPEYYIMSAEGAYVCYDYNRHYNFTNIGNSTVIYSVLQASFIEQIATAVSLAISIVCLTIVLVVYGLVKDLRNIPGKIVMSMSGALLLAQVIFLFSTYPRGLACQIYAAVQHAMWLASFAWLAVMAIHLAYVLYFQSHATSASTFNVFSSICWAGPFLWAGCCFALDKTGLVDIQYGMGGICWIGNARAMVYAFGIPLFTMLFVTLVCAVFVVRAIRKSSKFRHKNTLNHSGEKTQLLLCVNLSLLMGFNWVFYFLAVATDTTAMWTVFIVTNGSQGCYICLCYVARRAILSKVAKQLNICQGQFTKSRYAQGSPTVSHRVTKSTMLSSATSLKNLHLVVNPRSSPSSSPTPSPTRFDCIIAL